MYPTPEDICVNFIRHHVSLSEYDTDKLLDCLYVNEQNYVKELKQYDWRPRWSAQKCRKAAEDLRLNVLNELKRRDQDGNPVQS